MAGGSLPRKGELAKGLNTVPLYAAAACLRANINLFVPRTANKPTRQ